MTAPHTHNFNDQFSPEALLRALNSASQYQTLVSQIELSGLGPETMSWIKDNFTIREADTGLITGYYLPKIRGSLSQTAKYKIPVYRFPESDELVRSSRVQIENHRALSGRHLEIAWVEDKIDLFFVHIQGYAFLELEDGSSKILQKSVSNELPYFPIGRALIEQGKISKDKMSMQAIREYLKRHPSEIDSVLQLNPRYIYFSLEKSGPIGSTGSPLISYRSVASDWTYYPPQSLLYIETTIPTFSEQHQSVGEQSISFFALAQDSGSAITGKGRIDLYCGENHLLAGHLASQGRIYLLK